MNGQINQQLHPTRVSSSAPTAAGVGKAGAAAAGVSALLLIGVISVGTSALLGTGVGAGAAALADGNVKKGAKWGAAIGGGLGLLGVLPVLIIGGAAASDAANA